MTRIDSVSKKLIAYAEMGKLQFTFKGNVLSNEEVFSRVGMLPGIMKRVDKLMSLCLATSVGASFPKEEKSMLGYAADLDDGPAEPLVMLFVLDALNALAGAGEGSIPLDEFSYE